MKRNYVRMGYLSKTGYSPGHLRRLAHQREIPGVIIRPGKKIQIPLSERLEAWIQEATQRTRDRTQSGKKRRMSLDALKTGRHGGNYAPPELRKAARWAKSQIKELPNYTPGRAKAILSDIPNLRRLLNTLESISRGKRPPAEKQG